MGNEFKENLRRIRVDLMMSQDRLAREINVKQGTISSWESGRTEPSMGDIARLAKVLNCSQADLIGIEKGVGDITLEDILVKINSLSIGDLIKIDDTIKERLKIITQIEKLEQIKREQEQKLIEQQNMLKECEAELARLKGEKV